MGKKQFILPITCIVEINAGSEAEALEVVKAFRFGSTVPYVGGEANGMARIVGKGQLEEVPRHVFTQGPPPGGF